MTVAVSFDSFDLQDGTYNTTRLNPVGAPNRSVDMLPIARADGSVMVFQKFDAKTIRLEGYINSATREDLEADIDALKVATRPESGVLEFDWGTGVRMYDCVANLSIERGQENISFVPFTIEFQSESPFATDGTSDSLVTAQNNTTGSASIPITVTGTYDAQPVVTISIVAINPSVTASELTIGNANNSQYLAVNEIFTAGDELVIDCKNYRCFLNGNFVPSIGQFPYFAPGAGVLEYSDNCTTRDINITATAEKRYL